jgi:HAD superfamily hydrolase (TIGR01549 family)
MRSQGEPCVSASEMTDIKAVIFDLDGTLIDSNWVHLQSWREALKVLGLQVRDQEVIDRLGLRTGEIARALVSTYGEQTVAKLVELKAQLFENAWRLDVKPRYGALGILRIMKARGVRSAVASSGSTDRISRTVAYFGMDALLDTIVGSDQVEAGKPHPALVLTAINRLGTAPKESIYVGDSSHDVEAGRAAGAQTALVLQPVAAQSDLKVEPDYRLKTLYELRRIIWPDWDQGCRAP